MNVTAAARDRPSNTTAKSDKPPTKVPKGAAAEHIVISGDGTDSPDAPTKVSKRVTLSNRARGIQTELTFYAEGFLKIREYKRKKATKDYTLELRFVNPKPTWVRRLVLPSLWTSIGAGGVAALSWLIAKLTMLDAYLVPAAVIGATVALVALLLFLYQSGHKALFFTATGNVAVLALLANFGCLRRHRKLVSEISQAVGAAARANALDEEPYLRAEMQYHYRLRNAGVMSPRACSRGTARILAKFS